MSPVQETAQGDERRAAIRASLEGAPTEPHRLLDVLHAVRDSCGGIDEVAEQLVAEHVGLMHGRVAEVVSFYSYLTRARRLIRPCTGLACRLRGGAELLAALDAEPAGGSEGGESWPNMEVPCLGRCDLAPVALVGTEVVALASAADCREAAQGDAVSKPGGIPADEVERTWESIPLGTVVGDLADHEALGGLVALRQVAKGELSAETVLDELDASKLTGCGGAGFPTGRKWRFMVAQRPDERTIVVNADEGEPGTFKDRWVLERNPFVMLEGSLIAARTVNAAEVIVYIREEYDEGIARMRHAISQFEEAGLCATTASSQAVKVRIAVGAGAYICGEETALLESLEGRRGMPRLKPPFPVEIGYLGRPTLMNNVETLAHIPAILRDGGAKWAARGKNGAEGLRLFSLSGDVLRPGVYELPMGTTFRELIEEHGGGAPEGRAVKAFVPGGAAAGFLPASCLDVPMEPQAVRDAGSGLGSAAIIVLDETRSLREAAAELVRFFAEESCQQCTPCRLGTRALHDLLTKTDVPEGTPAFVQRVDSAMRETSICGLGMAAAAPLTTAARFFPSEFEGFLDGDSTNS